FAGGDGESVGPGPSHCFLQRLGLGDGEVGDRFQRGAQQRLEEFGVPGEQHPAGRSRVQGQDLADVHFAAQRVPGLGHGHANAVVLLGREEAGGLAERVAQVRQQRGDHVEHGLAAGRRRGPVRHLQADPVAVALAVQEALPDEVGHQPLHGRHRQVGGSTDVAQGEDGSGQRERVEDGGDLPEHQQGVAGGLRGGGRCWHGTYAMRKPPSSPTPGSGRQPPYSGGMSRTATPFIVIGSLGILAGGLLSAISAASPSYLASWAVAYLVLVVGAAQLVLGLGQDRLAAGDVAPGTISAELLAFNLANIAVLAGSLFAVVTLTWVGAALIIVAMALFIWAVRGSTSEHRGLLWLYRMVVVVLLISAPIGIVLAQSRMG